ncbi:hypothetical protein Glove_433g17 [Diversispora epigaea]|uniref:SAM domain-containing protein n=1 Tax=Diversispora epigaea TaxID=1348612 RepID=A0A397GUD1_9GLOM|nr:hypothetical protein Glove_433g17 [Diversispora epigaea]
MAMLAPRSQFISKLNNYNNFINKILKIPNIKIINNQKSTFITTTTYNNSLLFRSSNNNNIYKNDIFKPIMLSTFNRGLATESSSSGADTASATPGKLPVVIPKLNRAERDALVEKMKSYYKENYVDSFNKELLKEIPNWLDGMGLKGLAPCFKGVNSQDILKFTDWKQLRDLGIKNPAHRKRLMRNIWNAKRSFASDQGITLPEDKESSGNDDDEQNDDLTPEDRVDFKAIEDLPTWLNGMRDGYGYFAPHFEGRNWREIIHMTWEDLEVLGIRARTSRARIIAHLWVTKRALAAKNGEPIPEEKERIDRPREVQRRLLYGTPRKTGKQGSHPAI